MKLYQTSTVKPYIHNGRAGWLYERTEKDLTFYDHKYEAVAKAKKDLYNDVIDYLITYTKNGNTDFTGFGPRGRQLCHMERDYRTASRRSEFWVEQWREATKDMHKYKRLYEKQQSVINSLKELME